MNKKCKTCKFRASDTAANDCDYFLITSQRRGCSVEKCDKYEKGPRVGLQTHWIEPVRVGED